MISGQNLLSPPANQRVSSVHKAFTSVFGMEQVGHLMIDYPEIAKENFSAGEWVGLYVVESPAKNEFP